MTPNVTDTDSPTYAKPSANKGKIEVLGGDVVDSTLPRKNRY